MLDPAAAVELLRERMPEFQADIEDHFETFDELLFHLLMGDLARFYVREVVGDPEFERRFWMTVDWLEKHGDRHVENAIGVSLIEWFAWGNERERELLVLAKPRMSEAVRGIADEFLRAGGYGPDGRAVTRD